MNKSKLFRVLNDVNNYDFIVETMINIMNNRLMKSCGIDFSNEKLAKDFLLMNFCGQKFEKFGVLFLDVKLRLLKFDILYKGTVSQANVYVRPILQKVLDYNASSVILVHNHPSGSLEPSLSDIKITNVISDALGLIEVKVVDHFIVCHDKIIGFGARGLL